MPKRPLILLALVALSAALAAGRVAGQEMAPLRAEFWMELENLPSGGGAVSPDEGPAARLLLEEAAWIFAGMTEGFSFEWTPLDRSRSVAERFSLEPMGRILPGDPRLVPGRARREGSRLLAWVDFNPDATDRAALAAHEGTAWKPAQGRGSAELERGFAGRRAAYEDAMREGLRGLLRSYEPNKPRMVRGRVALTAPPILSAQAGRYVATLRLRAEITEILGYSLY